MKHTFTVCDTKLKPKKGYGNCILNFSSETSQEKEITKALEVAYPAPRYKVEATKDDSGWGSPLHGW